MIKKKLFIGMFFIIGILFLISFSSAYIRTVTSGAQYANAAGIGAFGTTNSLSFDKSMCEQGGKDLLVQIVPFGCVPSVVRSDLLEEQDVQVYCQLGATQINPLIDIEAIDYMSINGDYSKEVRGVGYFPSQAALGVWGEETLTSPILSNLGYVVVTLKEQANESAMPEYVEGNLTAKIRYDIQSAFGVGDVNFYLPVLNEEEWNEKYVQYSFWQGRGYLRALDVDEQGAQIAIYADDSVVTSGAFSRNGKTYSKTTYSNFYLNEGETSGELYLPGFSPCLATLNVKLNSLENPDTRVKLKVGSDYLEVAKGEKFLDNKCWVKDINKEGLYQSVKVYCRDDDKPATVTMGISPRVKLNIEGKTGEYEVGDWLFKTEDKEKSVYLGYVGSYQESENTKDLYVYLVALPEHKDKLSSSELSSVNAHANSLKSVKTGAGIYDAIITGVKSASGVIIMQTGKFLVKGEDFYFISYKNQNSGVVSASEKVKEKQVSLDGFGDGEDRGILIITEDVYELEEASGMAKDYSILENGEDTKLFLMKSLEGAVGTPNLKLNIYSGGDVKAVGTFYGEDCEKHEECSKYILSLIDVRPKGYEEFFNDLIGAEIVLSEKQLTVKKAVFDDSSDVEFNKYYENAMKDFETVSVSFPKEKDSDASEETYGERALYESISLASSLNKKKTMLELCSEFKEKYEKSILFADVLDICDNEYQTSSDDLSDMEVSVNGVINKISFKGIYEPGFEEYGIELFIQGPNEKTRTINLEKNKIISLNEFRDTPVNKTEYIKLSSLDEDSAEVYIYIAGDNAWERGMSPDTKHLELDNPYGYNNYVFTLKKINLEKSAKVSITGNENLQYTEADFGFKIGIEKRSIELTPERTTQKIKALNNSIEDWQKGSDALAGVVKTWKGACVATGATLTLKNLISNMDGKSIARQKVMQGAGGWNDKCAGMVSDGEYVSLDKCFLENSDAIDAEVNEVYKKVQAQNEEIKALEKKYTNDKKVLGNNHVDTDKFMNEYSSKVIGDLTDPKVQYAVNSVADSEGEQIDFTQITSVLSYGSWSAGKYSIDQLKEIQLYANILAEDSSSVLAKERLYNVLSAVETNAQTYVLQSSFEQKSGLEGSSSVRDLEKEKSEEIRISNFETFSSSSYSKSPYSFGIGKTIAMTAYVYAIKDKKTGEEYLFVYDNDGVVDRTYKINEDKLELYKNNKGEEVRNPFELYFKKIDENSLKNKYKNPLLKYYEEEPNKGNPAIVPFDTKEGWYAATKPVTASGSSIQAYDDSGVVKSFWLCNVGEDRLEDFFNLAKDDICGLMNLGTGQPTNQFSGLSETKASTLVTQAVNAIETAQRAYANGILSVRINGETLKVGEPAVSTPAIQCTDFMSPKECNLLFNVCDPVVCPSSRCDLGGTYPVKDVIQSGIIGSLALCLPNAKEGIKVPICISGVQAGMDGWISVQSSYRDCLQQNMDTGETIGICDEVYSIYMCDFFWKQALPIVKIGIPKLLSAIYKQNSRGGGEYLGVADALNTAKNSVDYLKSFYATNSWKAFKLRSTEEVGSEICKNFPSIVYPGSGSLLDSLIEPDSPVQFTGHFEENVYTTITNPPLSHYKVFYHIYAGKDTGAYYQVLLKQGTGSSYYQDTVLDRLAGSGYVPPGRYTSNTTDFTAPSGYKQLCIVVNGQEECGFESVSTSFAVNYMSDLYIKEQATTEVKTEAECISGSASLYSLLNPNIQSAAEEILDPAIYENGIIRVCSTANPGLGTDSYAGTEDARWVSVGYCGDNNVKCWLDRDKVKEIVKSLDVENSIMGETSEDYLNTLFESGNYLTTEEFKSKIKEIKEKEGTILEKVNEIGSMFDKVFFSNQKAQLFLIRGGFYSQLAIQGYNEIMLEKKRLEEQQRALEEQEEGASSCRDFCGLDGNIYEGVADPETGACGRSTLLKKECKEGCSEVYGMCNEDSSIVVSGEDVCKLLEVPSEIQKITSASEKVLRAARLLDGTIVPGENNAHCFSAVQYVYEFAGVGMSCVYSDEKGKQYLIDGKTITIGKDTKNGGIIYQVATNPEKSCSLNKQFSIVSYSQKLNNIEPGDLLSIVYDEDDGHNVIFIEWKDKVKGLAKVFDWNAKVIYEGAKSSGQECTSENFYSSSKKYCKVYQYTEKYILLDNKNSVYMYWKPYVPSSSSEIGKESPWGYFNPEEPEEETETEVDLSGLSSEQKKVYSSASECSDCRGGNIFSVIFNGNPCDEELCEAIEEKIGDSNCEYSNGYCKKGSSFSGESQFLNFVPVALSSTHPLNQVSIELSTFIAVIIWYGLLGLIIGLIYSILRSRVQNKKVFYVLLCSSVILIIGTVIIVNYYTLLLVFNA